MKKTLCILAAITLLLAFTSCTKGDSKPEKIDTGVGGMYKGTITMTKYDEAFVLAYLSPKNQKILANAKTAEMKGAAMSLITDQQQMIVDGYKQVINGAGSLVVSIWKNVNSKDTIDSDYIVETNVGLINGFGANYLPTSQNVDGYWAAFKDKRNGEMTINVTDTSIMITNKTTSEEMGETTYTLTGTIVGSKMSGTWSQRWDGTEVISGVFECEKTEFDLGDK